MVNQVGYNSAFVTDAMKYLQHTAVVEHKDNIVDDMTGSLTVAPLIATPTVLGVNGNYKNAQLISEGAELTKTGIFKKIQNTPSNFINGIKNTYNGIKNGTTTLSSVGNAFKNSSAYQTLSNLDEAITNINSNITSLKKSKNAAKNLAEINSAQTKLNNLLKQRETVSNAIESAAKQGTKVSDDILKNAEDVISAAKQVSKKGILSKIGNFITTPFRLLGSKITGSKAYNAIKSTETGAKILSKADDVLKVAKKGGMLFDLAIEGAMQLFGEIIPAFQQGGLDSGVKQIGKSGVQVAASVGGWAAGAKGGAAVGAAIGSIFPGAGTVIGGAIGGIVGGLLGSSLLTGIAKKITGKSEKEIIQEEQAQEQATLIANDSNSMQQLEQAVIQEIQLDMQDGELSEDSQKMLQYINSGALTTDATVDSNSFGSLTNTSSGLIATNTDGSYDYSVPDDLIPQISTGYTTNTNPYGFSEEVLI